MFADIDLAGIALVIAAIGSSAAAVISARSNGRKIDNVHATQRQVKTDLDIYNGKVEDALGRIEGQTKYPAGPER